MGAQESRLTEGGSDVRGVKGFHVLRVADSSPAAEAGIEPFFDYVVGVGGQTVSEDGDELTRRLEEAEGRFISLQVYSSRRQEVRNVRVLPNRTWSSLGTTRDPTSQPSLLGLSLRLCSPEHALDNVWHILDIMEGSPAQDAGLVPFGDWVIGYAGGVLKGESDLYRVIEAHEDRPLRLFVYNADYEVTREVVIIPNRSWGTGEGLLGCSIGFGLLHRIPKTPSGAAPSASTRAPITPDPNNSDPNFLPSSRSGGFSDERQNGFHASAGVSVVPTSHPSAPSTPPRPLAQSSDRKTPLSSLGHGRPFAPLQHQPQPSPPQQGRIVSPGGFGRKGSGGYGAGIGPPLSPSGRGKRSSVAEVIREEEE